MRTPQKKSSSRLVTTVTFLAAATLLLAAGAADRPRPAPAVEPAAPASEAAVESAASEARAAASEAPVARPAASEAQPATPEPKPATPKAKPEPKPAAPEAKPGTPKAKPQPRPATTEAKPATPEPKPEPEPALTPEAAALVEKVQSFYEKTTDFTARFAQTYTYAILGRTVKSAGTVAFRKPAMMRWDYETPRAKAFIVDGENLWIHTPEDKTAIKRSGFTSDSLSTSITFLWGKGRLVDEFHIELEGEDTLQLTPRSPQGGFSKVTFVVDVATGRVKTSIVVDAQGNKNEMVFTEVKLNTGLAEKDFQFVAPEGTAIQEFQTGPMR